MVEVRLLLSDELAEALRTPGGLTHSGVLNLRLTDDGDHEILAMTFSEPKDTGNGN